MVAFVSESGVATAANVNLVVVVVVLDVHSEVYAAGATSEVEFDFALVGLLLVAAEPVAVVSVAAAESVACGAAEGFVAGAAVGVGAAVDAVGAAVDAAVAA